MKNLFIRLRIRILLVSLYLAERRDDARAIIAYNDKRYTLYQKLNQMKLFP